VWSRLFWGGSQPCTALNQLNRACSQTSQRLGAKLRILVANTKTIVEFSETIIASHRSVTTTLARTRLSQMRLRRQDQSTLGDVVASYPVHIIIATCFQGSGSSLLNFWRFIKLMAMGGWCRRLGAFTALRSIFPCSLCFISYLS
jgi:hypothetical protein